ncbi:unnamed protein product [Heligmosomoides polygyrus]|uniref:Conserved plasma membrane protein n=1 Tax=Heligmosomoides polygyrus TaxID=6339 RepID=A0A183F1Z1_HELPZ|nr:unnamed protein product [Heligmosomoides polygyrus]
MRAESLKTIKRRLSGNSRADTPARMDMGIPRGQFHNEIDHIIFNRNAYCPTDVPVVPKFYTGSDYRLLRARFRFSPQGEKAAKFKKRSPRTIINCDMMSNVTGPAVILQMSVVFLCVFLNAHFVTMTLMLHIRDSLACSCLSLFTLILWLLFGGGMLRSLTTMPFGVVAYVFYLNPIRYVNCMISLEISSEVPIHNCVRSERTGIEGSSAQNFCRWSNGTAFLEESFPPSLYPQDYGTNLVVLLAIVFSLLLLTLAAHALPQPRQIVDRFRFVY